MRESRIFNNTYSHLPQINHQNFIKLKYSVVLYGYKVADRESNYRLITGYEECTGKITVFDSS